MVAGTVPAPFPLLALLQLTSVLTALLSSLIPRSSLSSTSACSSPHLPLPSVFSPWLSGKLTLQEPGGRCRSLAAHGAPLSTAAPSPSAAARNGLRTCRPNKGTPHLLAGPHQHTTGSDSVQSVTYLGMKYSPTSTREKEQAAIAAPCIKHNSFQA